MGLFQAVMNPMIGRSFPVVRTHPDALTGIAPEWVAWCQRWRETSPQPSRQATYNELLLVGRWLAHTHPQISSPAQWTRQTALDYVAAVNQMQHGEWSLWPDIPTRGQPLSMSTKQNKLSIVRRFFTDCQEWEWLPRHFDPRRYLALAPSQTGQAPLPRIIDDAAWAKLLWAGLNLVPDDLLPRGPRPPGIEYPFALMHAAAIVWLFGGLRANELRRLRVGCIHWERHTEREICWLSVPPSKSGSSLVRPVDRALGEAVQAWEAERLATQLALDTKTGEEVHFLFQYHEQLIGVHFLNKTLIPLLCTKAGIPQEDSRGRITSHRARATIASQLANAPEPMPLLALQDWLGHQSPNATLHYVQPNTAILTQAYERADYFARNVRTMTVFLDRQAIENGSAATETPWKYYDLGHGYCTYDFFERCPHRMACARCSFYRPKPETRDQLLESQQQYIQMLQEISLTEEEQAAVEADLEAVQRLYARLRTIPTPDRQTPTFPELPPGSGFIPLTQVR